MEPDHTVSPPNYQLPPIAGSHPERRRLIIGVSAVVVVLAIVVGIAAALFLYSPFATFRSALLMPKELKGALFLADTQKGGTIAYALKGTSYVDAGVDGTLVSASDTNGAQILMNKDTIYSVTLGGKTILATSTPVAGVSHSPDGAAVAFASQTGSSQRLAFEGFMLPLLTIDGTEWRIIYSRTTGVASTEAYGPTGTSPLFLDDSHIAYFSPAGISVLDTKSMQTTAVLNRQFRDVPLNVLQSPDRTLIGYRDVQAKTVTIYKVSPTSAEVVATLPIQRRTTSLTLGNDGIYMLHISDFGTVITKQNFTGGAVRTLTILPKAMQVDRLLIHTL